AALAVLLKFWRPKEIWPINNDNGAGNLPVEAAVCSAAVTAASSGGVSLPHQPDDRSSGTGTVPQLAGGDACATSAARMAAPHDPSRVRQAWVPWILLSLIVFIWGTPQAKKFLDGISAPPFKVSHLHNLVVRTPPVVPVP